VVGLVDFHFVLSILRVLLILSRLFRATISVFFVPCCLVLLSSYLVLLANVNVLRYVCYMLSDVRLSSVCLSSVTLVHPTQAVEHFGNFFFTVR